MYLKKKIIIGIIGLGYVGLPLAIEFGKKFHVIAFDKNKNRIKDLKNNFDKNRDISKNEFIKTNVKKFTFNSSDLIDCNVFIIIPYEHQILP